jgi:N-acetylglucosaminyldiphosphoundecaprenol N-acetyl-beta-D-mannosaminyltransferase
MRKKVNILNIDFDQLSLAETVNEIEKMIKEKGCFHIGTMNPEYLVRAHSSKQLKKVIANMDLILPDGVGIVLAAKWKNLGKLRRIRGGDLVEEMAALCEKNDYKMALIGGEKGIAQKALQSLQAKFPKLIGFADSGPLMGAAHDAFFAQSRSGFAAPTFVGERRQSAQKGHFASLNKEIIKKIIQEKPQVLLTAFGFKGPIWIDSLLKELRKEKITLVALEVGGVFNYLAGRSSRPPKVVQRVGLEWLWRLATEPWRWRRQLNLAKFIWLVARGK